MKPDQRIAVITDSTADLPPEIITELGIHVIPLNLTLGVQTWREQVDGDPRSFDTWLQSSSDLPRTSPPSAGVCQER